MAITFCGRDGKKTETVHKTAAQTIANGVKSPILAIQMKAGYEGYPILIDSINVLTAGAKEMRWALSLNPTLSADIARVDKSNSNIKYSIGYALETVTDEGRVLISNMAKGYVQGTDGIVNQLVKLQTDDVIVLWVWNVSAGSDTFIGGLNYRENVP